MKPLIVKINEDRLSPLKDAINRAVVQVQESKRATVARFALNVRHVQHVRDVQNVGVEVGAVEPVRQVARQVCKIGLRDEFLDFDVL